MASSNLHSFCWHYCIELGRWVDLGIAVLGVCYIVGFFHEDRRSEFQWSWDTARHHCLLWDAERFWTVVLEVAGLFCFCFHGIVLSLFFSFSLRNCVVRTGHFNRCFGGQFRLNGKLGTSLAQKGAYLELYMLPLYAAPCAVLGPTTTKWPHQNDHINITTTATTTPLETMTLKRLIISQGTNFNHHHPQNHVWDWNFNGSKH